MIGLYLAGMSVGVMAHRLGVHRNAITLNMIRAQRRNGLETFYQLVAAYAVDLARQGGQ